MVRALRNRSLVGLFGLSLVAVWVPAHAGDWTWARFQGSRAYANSNYYAPAPATVPPSPGAATASSGTYRSYSAEPGSTVVAPPVLQLYYYLDAGYYHYYYAPPRASASPAAPLSAPRAGKQAPK